MPLQFTIEGRDNMTEEQVASTLFGMVDEAAEANAEWYFAEWTAGRLKPDEKCCAGCAGLLYMPDMESHAIIVRLVPVLLVRGRASCQEAVAMSLGHERALDWLEGTPRAEARRRWRPGLEKTKPRYWHVVVMGPNGRDDPTEEMKKGPAGAGGCACSAVPPTGAGG